MPQTATQTYNITRFINGRPMRSTLPFDYPDPDLPVLRLLREQEGLDEIAAQATGEFDLIRRVMQHVKEAWDHSFHQPMQHVNALEVLEDVRSGLRGNFCVYFTHVLLQALWSVGIPCRYLHVGEHHWHNHSSSECWSNEHRKWIVADSDFDLVFFRPQMLAPNMGPVREYVPQSAREVQQAWRQGKMGDIIPSQGPWAAGMNYDIKLGDMFGNCIGYLANYERILDGGPPEWAGQHGQWFIWSEPEEPMPGYHLQQFEMTHGNGECRQVSDPDDYYWPVNEVVIEEPALASLDGNVLDLRFESFTPHFTTFEIQVDGGEWQALPSERTEGHRAYGRFRWELTSGRNVLMIRSRNKAGRLGPPAELEIAPPPYLPPQPDKLLSGRYHGMGGLATHAGKLFVPCGVVNVLDDKEAVTKVGTPTDWPNGIHPPPAEPWTEAFNIARARQEPLGNLFAPQGCTAASDGTLFVADAENYRVQVFAPDGAPRCAWGSHGTVDDQFLHIRALAAAPDGSVYVADSGYAGPVGARTEHVSRLRRFAADGRLLQTVASEGSAPGQVITPAGLCVDQHGNLWVADSGNHRVQCFSPEGTSSSCWGRRGNDWGQLRYPTDVAVAGDAVFVADPQHRCVWKFSREGDPLACLDRGADGSQWLRPGRLAVDSDRLFIGDTSTGLIHVFRLS
ncbi:MAG: transglutaminase domain-containing protein [Armatimonadota bacterium]